MLRRLGLFLALLHAPTVLAGCSADGPSERFVPPSQDELTIDALVAGAESGALASVDDLLDALPPEQRASVALIERSGSQHRADVEHPRVVFYGPDARVVVAVGTDPDDPRHETAELMELDEEAGAFRLVAITFGDEGASVEGEDRCTSCHGEEPRPIWGAYPVWPGAFGAEDNVPTEAQRSVLESADAADGSRLRHALEALDDDYYLESRAYGYPNTNLSYELGARVASWLVDRARRSGRYDRFAPALVALPQCGQVADERVRASLASMRDAVAAEALGSGGYEWEAIYDIWGLDLERDFAIASRADRIDASEGAQLTLWNAGSAYLDDLVRFLVLDELAVADPLLSGTIASAEHARTDIRYFGWELTGSARAEELARPDVYERRYLDPQARVLSAALGDFGAQTPERTAFCLRLGDMWEARSR